MRTLRDLINNPVTNPYTIDIVAPSVQAAATLTPRLKALPTVSNVIDIQQLHSGQPGAEAGGDRGRQLHPGADHGAAQHAARADHAAPGAHGGENGAATRSSRRWRHCRPDSPLAAIAGDLHQLETASDKVAMAGE